MPRPLYILFFSLNTFDAVGDTVTEEIGSSPHITAFFLELVGVASCCGVSLAL